MAAETGRKSVPTTTRGLTVAQHPEVPCEHFARGKLHGQAPERVVKSWKEPWEGKLFIKLEKKKNPTVYVLHERN